MTLDERERDAWSVYQATTQDLSGPSYAEAETHAWDQLQVVLEELAQERRAARPLGSGVR